MPPSRIAIDGLWRCLCPSFDVAALGAPLAVTATAPRTRQCLNVPIIKPRNRASIATSSHRQIAFGPRAADLRAQVPQRAQAAVVVPKSDGPVPKRTAEEEAAVREQEALLRGASLPQVALLDFSENTEFHTRSLHDVKDSLQTEGKDPPHSDLRSTLDMSSTDTEPPRTRSHSPRLDDMSIEELHDRIRTIHNEKGSYREIVDTVRYLLDERKQKSNLFYYDALVRANADPSLGSAAMVQTLLDGMKQNKIVGNKWFYHSCLQALAIHPDYILRAQVLKTMKERWYELTLEGWHNLIVGLLRDRQYEIALDKLEEMQTDGHKVAPWLYDIFIYLFCEAEELDAALGIMRQRISYGESDISANIWYFLLDACSSNYHYQGTLYIWQQRIASSQLNPSDGTLTNVLNLTARHADPTLATDVIRVLAGRSSRLDAHHYEALLAAYSGAQDLITAFRILCIMKKGRMEPSEGSTRPIYELLTSKTSISADTMPRQAHKIVKNLHNDGHLVPVAAINVILSSAIQVESLETAITYYKSFHRFCSDGPNTATFDILLSGCAKADPQATSVSVASSIEEDDIDDENDEEAADDGGSQNVVPEMQSTSMTPKETAMFLVSEMVALDVRASPLTYDRLILVCLSEPASGDGDGPSSGYEDAMLYLDEMRNMFGIPPKPTATSFTANNDQMLSEDNAKEVKCAPLRSGTWKVLVQRAADRGDPRVWAMLTEIERSGLRFEKVRAVVEDLWTERRKRNEERTKENQR